MRSLLLMAAALGSGCPRRMAELGSAPFCGSIQGKPSDARLAAGSTDLYGFILEVSRPTPTRYVLHVRGPSMRRRAVDGPTAGGCLPRPTPGDACTEVNVHDLMWDIIDRREVAGGPGLDTRLLDAQVHDWRHVDEAAATIAESLRAWRLDEDFTLRVEPVVCVEAL